MLNIFIKHSFLPFNEMIFLNQINYFTFKINDSAMLT